MSRPDPDGYAELMQDGDLEAPREARARRGRRCGAWSTLRCSTPHTLALLVCMMFGAMVLTWVLPPGTYRMQKLPSGRSVVVPGSYKSLENHDRLLPWQLLTIVPRAMAAAQDIIFFIMIAGGTMAVLQETGSIDALIGAAIARFRTRPAWLILALMSVEYAASSSLGTAAEYIALTPAIVSLFRALHFDELTAAATILVGFCIGYGCSLSGPFTVLVAQDIAGLAPMSGTWYRAVVAVPVMALGFHHVWRYARRVRSDPAASLVKDIDRPLTGGADKEQGGEKEGGAAKQARMQWSHRLVLLGCVAAIGTLTYGTAQLKWGVLQLSGVFLAIALGAALLARLGMSKTAKVFSKGVGAIAGTAILVGFARGIALTLEDGKVLHTVVYAMAEVLSALPNVLAAVVMLVIHVAINFVIPSGSGQAFVTMPIMVPVSDVVGLNRQTAVLAYQYGDGITNMIIPTGAVTIGILAAAGVPYTTWIRFIMPLMYKIYAVMALSLAVAVWIDYK